MDIHRAYKVLGLYPGATKDEVRAAYRDLAQVWHPDRFEHSDRLQAKAQRNLKRINEAYGVLKDFVPPADGPARQSFLSATYSAVLDLGDMLRTGVMDLPKGRVRQGRRDVVLGLGDIERTGVVRVRRKRKSRGTTLALIVIVVAVALSAALIILY